MGRMTCRTARPRGPSGPAGVGTELPAHGPDLRSTWAGDGAAGADGPLPWGAGPDALQPPGEPAVAVDMNAHRSTSSPSNSSIVARAQRRARTAAVHHGPSVGLNFDPATGTYRISISQTI